VSTPGERPTRSSLEETAGNGQPTPTAAHAALAAQAQAAAAERVHGPAERAAAPPVYAGIVTRAIAFAVDAAIVNGTGVLVGLVVGLGISTLNLPDTVDAILVAIGGVVFVAWTVGYFVTFWSATGQTPGNRLLGIRVRRSGADEPLRPRWALVRFCGLFLAALPLLLGFAPILVDGRRRGLQDFVARSVVVHAPDEA
jgi:uncharacterized RDD family membrane protein YckC